MFSAPPATTTVSARIVSPPGLDARRAAALDDDAIDRRVRAHLEQPSRPRVGDVRVPRGLAGVRRAALQARAAVHAVAVRVRGHRLELVAERLEPPLERVDALLPVVPLADAEPLLDPGVVRLEVGDRERPRAVRGEPGLGVPLGDVLLVRAQRDLRVDRRRPADAAAGEERDDVAVGERPEAERPPERVVRLRLPAVEVDRGQVRAGLEQEHVPAARGELAGDDPAAGPRADHHDIDALTRAATTSPCSAVARPAGRSRSRPRRPGRRGPARRSRSSTPRSRARGRTRTPA